MLACRLVDKRGNFNKKPKQTVQIQAKILKVIRLLWAG
ncbi:hypothetical protein EJK55_0185 [Moraxella catarrhalis]|uniref:Uncharacterized protein n=1 Tax=Moraxella catarrhalis TaxID=480 RepID=A0ABY0BI57_MORCA|nr:hypothetical protein EJK54_0125 [Moraxella catarrhalis]RUO15128.1 hypothetical protein EJK55_0185 [Moraxella catarrhalis]